jgi:hypothetical protein
MPQFSDVKRGGMTQKVTFRLDEKHHQELEACAVHLHASVGFLVRHLVVRFLEDQRRNNPSSLSRLGGLS